MFYALSGEKINNGKVRPKLICILKYCMKAEIYKYLLVHKLWRKETFGGWI